MNPIHLSRASRLLSLDDATNTLATLDSLGYQIVAEGDPGECVGDGDWKELANILRLAVPLSFDEASAALNGIGRMKMQIRKVAA